MVRGIGSIGLWVASACVALVSACGCASVSGVRTGLEVLEAEGFASLRGKRVGVLTNPTGVDRRARGVAELLAAAPGVRLCAIFAPEHGVAGAAQAGEAVSDSRDPRTGVPVFSLYGKARRPTPEMLAGIDAILFDVQDIGVRTYTYLSTLVELLDSVGPAGPEVWVLDRPVPVRGDEVEGPVLDPALESFVGPHEVPLRHGLTAGEFASLVNAERGIGAKLRVVRMEGYRRDMSWAETGLIWIPPSPNIPTVECALVYAGTVLIEGTNLSEGRGTTRPFHLVGAPWMDGDAVAGRLQALGTPGCLVRSARFRPAASKHTGEDCGGVEIHVTDAGVFRPVRTAVALLLAVAALHPGKLEIRAGTFDRLAGTRGIRDAIEAGRPPEDVDALVAAWQPGIEAYLARRRPHLLYW